MKVFLRTGLVAFLLLISTITSGQNNVAVFGVRAGINFSGTDNAPDAKTKVGFNIGITTDFRLSDKMYLLTGLEYTVKGAKSESFIPAGDDNWGVHHDDHTFTSKEKLGYLQLPFHVGYLWPINRDIRLMFHAGPYIAYAMNGKINRKSLYDDGRKEEETIDFFGVGVSKFDWGLGGGINLEYERYVLGLGYDRGLRNYTPDYNDKARTRNMYITLGYMF
ncbi:porin family protein [Dysgonomonas sp. 521]|uniref:porin family protein n=1 Tax=Dysgonomonas sp. 521 TaxID=2302932 RepID=UPI001625B982|nr:porin family protein [Dysgonomonas sp. 521]